jgi:hypothetical protein
MRALGYSLVAGLSICLFGAPLSRAGLFAIWPFEMVAKAPVIVTATVQDVSRDPLPPGAQRRVLTAHATLRVLRSLPPSAFAPGDRIRLDYETIPDGPSMDPPAGPLLKPGLTLSFPLKLNPEPASASWMLLAGNAMDSVIPAIVRDPPFAGEPQDGSTFLLREIASTLLAGTRGELLSAVAYCSQQNATTPGLMPLLESELAVNDGRWSLIAAAFLSSLPIPRPTVSDLQAGNVASFGNRFAGSLIMPVLQKLGPSQQTKEELIHQLLVYSDLASWGVGMTVPEFSREPALIRELQTMLKDRRPGSLSVARSMLIAGQKDILADATALSFQYLALPHVDPAELQAACWVIRDFGSDDQFGRLLGEIRDSQYRDSHRYDELWRNLIWSDNPRERAVLDILLKDDRTYQENMRYSDLARGELTRIQARK